MLTAHLPSGYVLAKVIGRTGPWVMGAALLGAVAPDFDMLWFYFVDQGQTHHHRFWPHIPAIWLAIAIIIWPMARHLPARRLPARQYQAVAIFLAAVALHLLLDSLAGGIMWLWPINDRLLHLVTVPPRYGHWVLNFILHWTFLAEISIWIAAAVIWLRQRRTRPALASSAPRG